MCYGLRVVRKDFEFYPFGNAYFVTSECRGAGEYDTWLSDYDGFYAAGLVAVSFGVDQHPKTVTTVADAQDMTARKCFNKNCGAGASQPAKDAPLCIGVLYDAGNTYLPAGLLHRGTCLPAWQPRV